MSGETQITVVGNLTADPEMRSAGGVDVLTFTIASTPRVYDRQANEWKDADTLFLRAQVWRDMAENAHLSLSKGTRVIAQGLLKQRSFETQQGEKRTVIELEVQDIGPSLRNATAQVTRRSGGGGGQRQQPAQQQEQAWGQSAPAQGGWPAAEPGTAWGAQ